MKFLDSRYRKIKVLNYQKLNIDARKSIRQLKKIIVEEIKQVLQENIDLRGYQTGLFLVSSYLHDRLLKQGFNRTKNIKFFDPIKFINSILNSFTYEIASNFEIRGYSNSYIFSDADDIISDFLNIDIINGVFIFIEKEGKDILFEIHIIKKS